MPGYTKGEGGCHSCKEEGNERRLVFIIGALLLVGVIMTAYCCYRKRGEMEMLGKLLFVRILEPVR